MEHTKPQHLQGGSKDLMASALASSALVLPFMILELVNRRSFHEGYPIPLFSLMWLLQFAFALGLIRTVAKLKAGANRPVTRLAVVTSLLVMILVAFLWVGIVLDQMPCFLGVPNCD